MNERTQLSFRRSKDKTLMYRVNFTSVNFTSNRTLRCVKQSLDAGKSMLLLLLLYAHLLLELGVDDYICALKITYTGYIRH